jgi:hypothetical protein
MLMLTFVPEPKIQVRVECTNCPKITLMDEPPNDLIGLSGNYLLCCDSCKAQHYACFDRIGKKNPNAKKRVKKYKSISY